MSDIAPPYPTDTRAKGWRFELDYEKIDQSDTWPLAAEIPMCQHALLMMWLVAWSQTPCGSFPNDEATIRAKCKIPPSVWVKCRAVLMRGWWLATDGRLYHNTITSRVLAMLAKRANDAERAANNRARRAGSQASTGAVTPESRVISAGVHGEFDTKHQAPEPTQREEIPPATRVPPAAEASGNDRPMTAKDLQAEGVDICVAKDWLKVRKAKKAPLTATAWEGVKREAAIAGMTPGEAVKHAAEMSWQGFKAAWMKRESSVASLSFRERDAEAAAQRIARLTGGMANAPLLTDQPQETVDVAAIEVHARRLA